MFIYRPVYRNPIVCLLQLWKQIQRFPRWKLLQKDFFMRRESRRTKKVLLVRPFNALIGSGKPVRCFHCNKMGHVKKNCRWLTGEYGKGKTGKSKRAPVKANKASAKRGSSSESDALIAEQALQVRGVGNWIIDSRGYMQHI